MRNLSLSTTKLVFLTTIIFYFSSCKQDDYHTAVDFYSTVEKNDKVAIQNFLIEVEDKEIKESLDLLLRDNKEIFTTKYSNKFEDYINFKKIATYYDFAQQLNYLDSILPITPLSRILVDDLHLYKLESVGKLSKAYNTVFDVYEQKIKKPKTTYEIYHYITFLKQKSLFLWTINRYSESMATAQYGRHLLSKNKLFQKFPKLNLKLLELISIIQYEDQVHLETAIHLGEKVLDGYQKYGYLEETIKYKRSHVFDKTNDTVITTQFHELLSDPSFKEYRSEIASNFINFLSYKRPRYLVDHLSDLNPIVDSIKHDKKKGVAIYNIAFAFLDIGELDSAMNYINKIDEVPKSIEMSKIWLESYTFELLKTYHNSKYWQTLKEEHLDSAILYTVKQFELNKTIFSDDLDHHLDNYYMEIVAPLISLLSIKKSPTKSDIDVFFNYLNIAQADELKRQSLKTEKTPFAKIQLKIDEKLRQVNNWHDVEDASNPLYKNIYELYEERRKIKTQKIEPIQPDVGALRSKLAQENAVLIGYLNSEEDLGYYFLDSINTKFSMLDKPTAQRQIDTFVTDLIDQNLDETETEVPLLLDNLETYDRVYIIADGDISKIPMSFFYDQEVVLINDPMKIVGFKKETIDPANSSFYSLSNNEILRDLKTKKKYPPLPHGFESCQQIVDVLNIPTVNIISGKEMTQHNLISNMSQDICHISTHGFSNQKIINDNYLIVYEGNSMEKMYTTDFDGLEEYPKFVYLDGCNTAKGTMQIGEGVYSLSRIFAKNHVEGIIKTLWPIDDESSSIFSKSFYKNWNLGHSSIQAFNKAQNEVKALYPNPSHWAPFVYEGNPNLYLKYSQKDLKN